MDPCDKAIITNILKERSKETALETFMKVSAPDRTDLGYLYYDKHGEGLIDTFANSSEIHKHQQGNRIFFTNDKGEKFIVAKSEPYHLTNQKRLAENEKDFEKIYQREFLLSGLKDTPEQHSFFKQGKLKSTVEKLMQEHEDQAGKSEINAPISFLAIKFLEYIQQEPQKVISKINTSVSLEDLFINKSEYTRITVSLLKDGSIINSGDSFSVNIRLIQENNLSEKRAICAFGYLLRINGYLRDGDSQLAAALSSFFQVEISKGTYSRAKNQCFKRISNRSDIAYDYFALFPCLKILS